MARRMGCQVSQQPHSYTYLVNCMRCFIILQGFWLGKSTNAKLRKLDKGAGGENYSVMPCLHHSITVPVNKDHNWWETSASAQEIQI